MRIAIGSDHAGFNLKEYIKGILAELAHEYEDFGCYDTASVDYPLTLWPRVSSIKASSFAGRGSA